MRKLLQQLLVRICNVRSSEAVAHGSPDNSMHTVASLSAPRHSTSSRAEAGPVEAPHSITGLQEGDDTADTDSGSGQRQSDSDVDSDNSGRFRGLPPLVRV